MENGKTISVRLSAKAAAILADNTAGGQSITAIIERGLEALERERAMPRTVEERLNEMTDGLSKVVDIMLEQKAGRKQQDDRLAFACDKANKSNIMSNIIYNHLQITSHPTAEQQKAFVEKRAEILAAGAKSIVP